MKNIKSVLNLVEGLLYSGLVYTLNYYPQKLRAGQLLTVPLLIVVMVKVFRLREYWSTELITDIGATGDIFNVPKQAIQTAVSILLDFIKKPNTNSSESLSDTLIALCGIPTMPRSEFQIFDGTVTITIQSGFYSLVYLTFVEVMRASSCWELLKLMWKLCVEMGDK